MNLNDNLLDNLTKEEKQIALEILKEYSEKGISDKYEQLLYSDYNEIPVDIITFLHDKQYLGNALYDAEGKFTVFPYWEEKLKEIFPTNTTTAYNTIIFTGAIGLGKAQPLYSKVLTQDGYKNMGDLTLLDRVYGKDGRLHQILGIFPQGKRKTYRIFFKDGTYTDAADNHLWTIYDKRYGYREETLTTEEILNTKPLYKINKFGYKERILSIPLCDPVEFEAKSHIIDPYLLGLLIGDGSLCNNCTSITSVDPEILESINNILDKDGYILSKACRDSCRIISKDIIRNNQYNHNPNIFNSEIKRLSLNVKSRDKFVPDEYKFTSVSDRVALLQGLLDTDGTINKDGSIIQFNTISPKLADDVCFIVRSLGGIITSCTWHPTSYKKNNQYIKCQNCCTINIKLPKNICPFRLSRKKNRLSSHSIEPRKLIENIEYIGEEECQCIYIDSDNHLYLTNDFIVTHNTLVSVICLLYLLYRLLCLKDPYLYYGLQPIDKISISMMNITIENAKGVAMDKLNQMILSSTWFMNHGTMSGVSNLEYTPNNHIELIAASSNNQVIGRAIFANFSDEVNFGISNDVEKLKKKYKSLVSAIDARMKSRFMRGTYLPTLNIIASSKSSDQSFLDSYINSKRKNESKTTLIVDEPQWVVDSRKDNGIYFYVAIGNKFLASELLPKDATKEIQDEYRSRGYSLLKVPEGYYENFQDNIDGALTDIAGISTASSLKYISGIRWNDIKMDTYQNPFTKEILEIGNAADDHYQYSDFFDLKRIPISLRSKPIYIHLDMSTSGDKTGIAGTYILGKRPKVENEDSSREMYYQAAFNVSIKAPKGYQISFDKNRAFIRWLREKGFNIKGISCDTYQSAQIQQQLIADHFNVTTISVDRLDTQTKKCLPYEYFKSTLYDRRFFVYKDCDFLTEEVLGLERESDGHINHPEQGTQGCFTGDTKVSLVDGRELTFLELVDEFNAGKVNYVYSFNDKTKRIEAKPITNAWCTRKNAPLIEVELDNGEKLRCTPNHKFMMRDGTYKEAKDLTSMDSLMPLYRKFLTKEQTSLYEYRLYYEPIEDKWHYEHRSFCNEEYDNSHEIVHHKNCNKTDNSPTNLIYCSKANHQRIHAELSTGSHSLEAEAKRSASIKKWHENNKDTDIYLNRSKKLHDANLKQHDRTENDYLARQQALQAQHRHGILLKYQAEKHKQEVEDYHKAIETMFNVCWQDLSNNEKESYAVKYQRATHPETQELISAKLSDNHKKGKYINAKKALAETNAESKKLKELCPIIDKEKFFDIFGFEYDSIASNNRAPWATKYRRIVCKDILNHKVIAIRALSDTEDVYDITVEDNHNFALTAGVFVHNSKDAIDAIVGSMWNASMHADEYAYEYGEDIQALLQVSFDNDIYQQEELKIDFEKELNQLFDPVKATEDNNTQNYFMDFGFGKATNNFNAQYVMNGIIL